MGKYLVLFFFYLTCFSFADIKDDDIYINGPEISLSELWRQIEQHSPYRVHAQQISQQQKSKLVRLDGLWPLTEIVNLCLSTLGPQTSFREEGHRLTFVSIQPSAPLATDLPDISELPDLSTEVLEQSQKKATILPPAKKQMVSSSSISDDIQTESLDIKHFSLSDEPSSPSKRRAKIKEPITSSITQAQKESEPLTQDKELLQWNLAQAQITTIHDDTPATTDSHLERSLDNTVSNKSLQYQLKPGDRIEISVWGEDMTRELIVSPDGRISYILVGVIDVLNMTFLELKAEIETRLSKFLLEPNVTIIGKSYEGNYVSILGAVNQPGRKVVSRSDRVIDVIAKAQGLRYENFGDQQGEVANLKGAYLSRSGALVTVDFSKLLYEGDMSQNVPVEIGDFIYIPSSTQTPIYITGEVYRPTSIPYRGEPTLLEAISRAQGINTKANRKEILIVQGGIQNPQIRRFNFFDITSGKVQNPLLEPGDIVHVPSTTLTKVERIATQIIPFLDAIIGAGSARTTVQDW